MELIAGVDDAGRRLDRILRKALPDESLSFIHRLLRQGKVLVNGIRAEPDTRISANALIHIEAKTAVASVNQNKTKVNNKLPSLPEILWREMGIIVFNKPAGLASHGPDSLDTAVKNRLAGALPHSLSFKPGPLHRLDRPTSGAIAFSETLEGARWFSHLLREQKVTKTYLGIVEGCMRHEEIWEDALARDTAIKKTFAAPQGNSAARNALTAVKPLACNGSFTLIEACITTGRTHQIRSQAALHGYPLAGDVKYGGHVIPGLKAGGVFFLHAWKMEFAGIPVITAPPPQLFMAHISRLFPQQISVKPPK